MSILLAKLLYLLLCFHSIFASILFLYCSPFPPLSFSLGRSHQLQTVLTFSGFLILPFLLTHSPSFSRVQYVLSAVKIPKMSPAPKDCLSILMVMQQFSGLILLKYGMAYKGNGRKGGFWAIDYPLWTFVQLIGVLGSMTISLKF